MKTLPMKRMAPDERAEVRAIRAAIVDFAASIRPLWPDVDTDLCFEQLCSLGGHNAPSKLDAKARKAVLSVVIQSRGKIDLGHLLHKQARYSGLRRLKKERKKNPPKPSPQRIPDNTRENTLIGVEEHVLVLASLPADYFLRLPEWRSLRMFVLQRCGGRCEMCGASRKEFRLEPRHIIPRHYAPERAFDPTNIKALCPRCSSDGGWTRQIAWDGC